MGAKSFWPVTDIHGHELPVVKMQKIFKIPLKVDLLLNFNAPFHVTIKGYILCCLLHSFLIIGFLVEYAIQDIILFWKTMRCNDQ